MPVGTGFGNWNTRKTLPERLETSPTDRCTIVSVYHREIVCVKPTIMESRYVIPAAADNDFSLLIVGPSSWWKETDEHSPLLEMLCPSVQIAKAIVNDKIGALLGAGSSTRKPGIFYIQGEYNKKSILAYVDPKSKKGFGQLLLEARNAQTEYYKALVKIADILWARTQHNPLAISDEARMAAEKLNVDKQKAWMGDIRAMELVPCKACGHMVNQQYPICPNCKNSIEGIKAVS